MPHFLGTERLSVTRMQVCIAPFTMLAFRLILSVVGLVGVHAAQIPFFEDSHDRKPGAPEEIYIKHCQSTPPHLPFRASAMRLVSS